MDNIAASASTAAPVRVRFCPSPTGTPHVGMVRTALFNWAYARHTGGTFVFRIEDTDANRDSEESFDQIIASLKWLGLTWDEGVGVGGPHGPYRQSERMEIYREVAERLLSGGYAYESYSTPEEVEARHLAAGRSPKLGYDNYDRNLTAAEIAAFQAAGRKPVIRIRMPDSDVTFKDLVRGEVTFKPGSIPDYVIVRANGAPLYTLVNPIDDALMEITHVLRGEDLLSSTPRQVVLNQALIELGIAKYQPKYGHLPYVMGEGNKKLSKRDPESNLLLHRDNGMIPEGLVNYLALLGWSISPDHDIFTAPEMVAAFDVSDVNPNPARFDLKKCTAINADHIRMLDTVDFAQRCVPYLKAAGLVSGEEYSELTEREREIIDFAAPLVQTRIQLLGEVPAMMGFLFIDRAELDYDEKALKKLRPEAADVLTAGIAAISDGEFTVAAMESRLRAAIVEGMELKPRFAFGPLRLAITGRQVSPPLFESMEILGREESLARFMQLRNQLG